MTPGKLIVIEGPDGAGKTLQTKLLAAYLTSQGIPVLCSREPGNAFMGQVRHLILNEGPVPLAELFLFMADRAQHVSELVKPTLAEGTWVILDRFVDSTIAYQWFGRGDTSAIRKAFDHDLGKFVGLVDACGLTPDLILSICVSTAEADRRLRARNGELTALDLESEAFKRRVASYFKNTMPQLRGQRVVTIDGGDGIEAVAENIAFATRRFFNIMSLAA